MIRAWMIVALSAGMAIAHGGVQNPTVMARMEQMSSLSDATKLMGQMVKGETPYDEARVRAALEYIAKGGPETIAAFETPADDPKSEALPAIWETFADFTEEAQAMEIAARAALDSAIAPKTLPGILKQVAGTCRSCHDSYRK